jgi:uncharacterized damage-inducible protein DinB
MEDSAPMEPALAPLGMILELNTDLLLNCLDGLSAEEGQLRLEGGGNSIAYLAAHLTDSRHFLATRLGHPLPNPLAALLADARGIEDIRVLPPLEEIRGAWLAVSRHLAGVLARLGPDDLTRAGSHRFPLTDSTPVGMIAFLMQHDSYHIGQMAFLRRQLGRPAMAYTRQAR